MKVIQNIYEYNKKYDAKKGSGVMLSAKTSCMNHVWLFLNQYQRDAEPELLNGPRGTNTSAGNAVR